MSSEDPGPSSSSSTDPHGRSRQRPPGLSPEVDDEAEDDPVDRALRKAGCAEAHYAVQDCMVTHRDWRRCQDLVKAFKDCIENNRQKHQSQ